MPAKTGLIYRMGRFKKPRFQGHAGTMKPVRISIVDDLTIVSQIRKSLSGRHRPCNIDPWLWIWCMVDDANFLHIGTPGCLSTGPRRNSVLDTVKTLQRREQTRRETFRRSGVLQCVCLFRTFSSITRIKTSGPRCGAFFGRTVGLGVSRLSPLSWDDPANSIVVDTFHFGNVLDAPPANNKNVLLHALQPSVFATLAEALSKNGRFRQTAASRVLRVKEAFVIAATWRKINRPACHHGNHFT